MATAKDIRVKPIGRRDADRLVKAVHYSGKVVQNSQLHLGVFLEGRLHGAMQFGPPLQRSAVLGLVEGTAWHDMLELNRMAFDEHLPRNSESRALGVAMRMLRKQYPNLEWILSYADGTQCGDGTIYRAAGFVLTAINKNKTLGRLPSGEVVADISLRVGKRRSEYYRDRELRQQFEPLAGYQLRYIYFLNPAARARLTVPELPFEEIKARGAAMYKGKAREVGDGGDQLSGGGSTPTRALHES